MSRTLQSHDKARRISVELDFTHGGWGMEAPEILKELHGKLFAFKRCQL
jgi:hypothetical protein